MENKVYLYDNADIMMGADPEFFFSTATGDVIGSEKILTSTGAEVPGRAKIIIDGVQAELNPGPKQCRALLGMNIRAGMIEIDRIVKEKNITTNFSTAVKLSEEELQSLSPGSRTFGCAPSKNLNKEIEGKISVDPTQYKYRSAGGHIHLGKYKMPTSVVGEYDWKTGMRNPARIATEKYWEEQYPEQFKNNKALDNTEKLIPLLDAIVGNTCVLVDRDPMNKERRKVYGKAGEFRTPRIAEGKAYDGLEYRTLSNFWLRDYPLMSMVFLLARNAVHVLAQSTEKNPFADMVLGAVDRDSIVQAINENDYMLAWRNFTKIEKVMTSITDPEDYRVPFAKNRVKYFRYFLRRNPDRWFGKNPLENWKTMQETQAENNSGYGFESFLEKRVAPDMISLSNRMLTAVKHDTREVI